MVTIVFVDDDPNVLAGLRRATRRRRDWSTHFAEGGAAALELLAELDDVDVVVSDMRMPGMDGAELLAEVQQRWPHISRVVLSGQCDDAVVTRTISSTHQFISKPTSLERLSEVIDRLTPDRGRALGSAARDIVGRVDRLPAVPRLLAELQAVLDAPSGDFADVAELLRSDVGLTAEVLKAANSAFFGRDADLEDVGAAASMLGMDTIRAIVVSREFGRSLAPGATWLDITAFSARSLARATAARGLACARGGAPGVPAEAFLVGMVSEVGLLVMAQSDLVTPSAGARLVRDYDPAAETELVGATRYEIGAHLLRLWAFRDAIVDAVAGLGAPIGPPGTAGWCVAVARGLIEECEIDASDLADGGTNVAELDRLVAELVGDAL